MKWFLSLGTWLVGFGVAFILAPLAQAAGVAEKLNDAPANTWVKLADEPTGGREWPMFHFDPTRNAFILSGGGHEGPAHFDTEVFDVATARWVNAYPVAAQYKNTIGPTDAGKVEFRDTEVLKFDDIGCMLRFRKSHGHPESVVATFVLDYDTRKWLKAEEAYFVKSKEFKTPMGGNVVAFKMGADAAASADRTGGVSLRYAALLGDQ